MKDGIPWDVLEANLVTEAGIARRIAVSKTTVNKWDAHLDWPEPVMIMTAGTSTGQSEFYWWPDVEAFMTRHGYKPGTGMPRPGRPRNTERDAKIVARAKAGEKHEDIAADLEISRRRVSKIVRDAHGDGMDTLVRMCLDHDCEES